MSAKKKLSVDQAVIAVLIAAMEANRHTSREEAARAHHIIWSMRRFRRRSGDAVGRLIETVRDRIEQDGVDVALQEAARALPARLRPSAFAVAVDLMLADATLQRAERRFAARLAAALGIGPVMTRDILRVMSIKNGA